MATLTFNGKTIELEDLLKSSKSFPRIEVKREELTTYFDDVSYAERSSDTMEPSEPVCMYKHECRWVVLSGHDKVREFIAGEAKILKAMLVSKQMLKHLQVVAIPAQEQNRQAAAVERQMREAEGDGEDMQNQGYRRDGYGDRNQYRRDVGRDRGNFERRRA